MGTGWLVDNVEKRPRAPRHILSIIKPTMYSGNSGGKMQAEIPEQPDRWEGKVCAKKETGLLLEQEGCGGQRKERWRKSRCKPLMKRLQCEAK